MSTQQSKLDIIIDTRSSEQKAKDMARVLLALEQAGIRASRATSAIGNTSSGVNNTSSSVRTLTGSLGQTVTASQRAQIANAALASSYTGVAVATMSVVTAMAALQKMVSVQREFDKLNAALVTAAGSAEEAEKAFEAIQDFARTTPYGLAQSVEAFVKLTNLGLTPSERALRSYGNTAAALGKDLMQFIEAVADASTFEFERLKEFGIKASQEGDKVRLTFQGTTTEIKKSAADIEQYLMSIGEINFAGTMENRAKTLDGAISALGDSWDNLFLTISQSGTGDLIKEMVNDATGAIDGLTNRVDSGEIPAALGGIGKAFSLFGTDAESDIKAVKTLFSELANSIGIEGKNISTALNDLGNDFSDLRYGVQVVTTFVAASIDAAKNPGGNQDKLCKEEVERLKAERDARQDVVKAGFEQAKMLQLLDEVETEMAAKQKAEDRLAKYKIKPSKSAPEEDKEAKKALDKAKRELEQRKKLFEALQFDSLSPSKKLDSEFQAREKLIAEFTKKGSIEQTRLTEWIISEKNRENAEIARQHRKALAQYTDVLDTEEQVIRNKYNDMRDEVKHFADYSEAERERALAGIQKMEEKELQAYRDKTSQLRASFDERYRLRFDFDQKLKAIDEDPNLTPDQKEMGANVVRNQHNDGIKSLNQPYNDMMSELGGTSELDRLKADEEAKMTIIRDALTQRQITEEEAAAARLDVERNYMASRNDLLMSQGEQMLGSMSSIMKAMGGEQSKAYKVMFAIEKGVSIARSIMAIQTGIALAAATPFPANLGAMASVAAATANIVGSIQSIKLAGQAHDGIDYVPREGTWLLDKGERVLSPRQNADLDRFMQDGGAKGGGTMMNVEVHNYGSSDIQVEQVSDDRIRIIARDVAQSEIARDGGRTAATALSNPNSDMSKGVSRNFNVERRRS